MGFWPERRKENDWDIRHLTNSFRLDFDWVFSVRVNPLRTCIHMPESSFTDPVAAFGKLVGQT